MSTKFKVGVSQYISERDCFLITVHTNFCFLGYPLHPVVVNLEHGTQHKGTLLTSKYFPPKDNDLPGWILVVRLDELIDPEIADITNVEIT